MKGLKFPLYSCEVYSKNIGYWPPYNNLHYDMYSTHEFLPADAILSINFTIFGSCCCVQFDDLSELWKSCFLLQNLSWILFSPLNYMANCYWKLKPLNLLHSHAFTEHVSEQPVLALFWRPTGTSTWLQFLWG